MSGSDATRIQEGFSSLCHDGHGEGSQLADDENPELVPFPIAIVGMSMRLPGGVRSEKELWEMLINKRDGRCTVPEDRYNIEAFCDDARPGSIRTKHGYFLQQDISQVDAAFFGMSAIEAAKLDPQQRILLEVIWECLENSGQVPAKCRGKNIGCYVGVFGEDWLDLMSKDTQAIDRFRVVSAADFALSNRISYEYDLRGPSITYRTGCSSALVGLHEACQALYTGECTSALVAGSNLIITPTTSTAMSETMALAPDGISKTFDAAADGYGRGEAVNAIYIKPLHACLRDGDPIRAVIRSTAVNCDGRTTSITTPGSQAQEALIRRAYQKAGIDELAQTAFFECHGTGTIVGDTAETSVIAKVFGQDGIHIGAVKPNLGHSEGASGITSVIKSVLSLEQRTIPPNIHFNNPNPKISFKEAKLQVPVHPTSWPAGRCERISINSFGIGGTNAHLILDSAHSVCREPIPKGLPNEKPSQHILLASAKSETALENSINTIKDYVAAAPDSVSDLAYTLAYKREHLQHRAFAIVEKDGGALTFEKSRAFYPQVCFVFTGQGAQWPGMGKEMITRSMSFRLAIQKLDKELQGLEDPPDWKIEDKLLNADNSSEFKEARFAQPLCTAIQLALVDVLRDVGVVPSVVVGHSSGEIAAAYASGALNAATAIKIAYCRGLAMESLSVHGTMAAIGLGRAEIEQYLRDGAVLACENSQDNVTISGNTDAVEAVINEIGAKDDVFCRRLAVEVAYHSHHMKEAGQSFETLLSGISFNKSMTPLVSTVTNETISDPKVLDPAYWRKNVESPVLFHTAVQKILQRDKQAKVFLEIGPHSTLSGPLRQNISHADAGKTCFYTPTLIRGKDQWRCWLATIGQLHSLGTPVDIASTICRGKTLTDLPPYSWDHNESYWTETRLTRDWRLRQAPHHELLGTRTLESSDLEPVWRNMLQLDNVTWIMEHMLGGEIVFPGAGYVAMAGEAIQQITGVSAYSVRNMSMRTALSLKKTDTVPTEILTSLRPVKLTDYLDAAWYEFSIVAHQDGVWRKHCVGQVRAEPDEPDAGEPVVSYARKIASDEWYNALELRGFEYGPRFRRLREITASPTTLEATAALSDVDQPNGARYTLHPVMIDQCLQLFSVACAQGVKRRMTQLCIPSGIEGLYVAKGHKKMFLKAGCDTAGSTMTGNSSLVADDGSLVLDLKRCLLFGITDSALLDGKCGPSAGTLRLEPHINFAAPDTLLPPVTLSPEYAKLVTEGTRLFIVEAYHRTRSARPTKEYLKKYHQWLFRTYKKIELEEPDLVPEMKDIPASDPRSRLAKLQAIDDIIETPLARSIFNAMRDVFSSIEDILNEQKSGLEVIMDSEAVAGVYEHSSRLCDLNRFMSLLCHSKPNLRILEVGAGTGGTTAVALEALSRVTSHMVPMYGSYTFTDISAGFFNNAKERFKEYSGIRYETFDITRDPEEQGFSARAYDLIIASNVVHATPSKSQTLRNLRSLLAPGGWLFLTELCPSVISIQFIMGVLPGWWAAEDSTTDPTISTAQWHHELLEAGFTGTDVARTATDPRYEFNAYILSRRPREPAPVAKEINFLHGDTIPSWARTLEHAFLDIGCHVQWFTVHSLPPSASDIISLIELDRPFFHDLSKEGFETFKSIVSRIRGHCLWLMRPVQFHHNNFDPRFALTLGMMRVLRKEVAAKFTTLELDQHDCNATKNVVWVLEEVRRHNHQLEMDVDYEYVLKEGAINVGRYHFDHLHQVVPTSQNFESRSLDIGCLGILDSLTWALDGRVQAPGEREVEVDIHFVGVNFRVSIAAPWEAAGQMSWC
ncbi:unnamed protein product [Penicillium salamii]|nr:unnamed protein product [Penicillium salamii]